MNIGSPFLHFLTQASTTLKKANIFKRLYILQRACSAEAPMDGRVSH